MIGIFDSGLGGLTAYREVRRLLPKADIVYFGDTGRVPYGNRSKETLVRYATQDMNFLMSRSVDAVLVACGTVSSTALPELRVSFPEIPLIGVVDSAAREAVKLTKSRKIGVIATAATVKSGAFERSIRSLDASIEVISTPCPLFVPLVENGFISPEDEVTRLVAERYLAEIRESGADVLILGCTHYPIIAEAISRALPGVTIVSSSAAAARELAATCRGSNGSGLSEFYVSDEPVGFEALASTFLDESIERLARRVNIYEY